jgi:hypothetical protein
MSRPTSWKVAVEILHPYAPGVRPADQVPCWDALGVIRLEEEWLVYDIPCVEEYDYAEGLNNYWTPRGGVLIVEHDIAPTVDQVRELEQCPELFCAMDYAGPGWLSWATVLDTTCIGLAKLSNRLHEGNSRQPFVPRVPWRDVGGTLEQCFGRPHIHPGPVAHYHT